ncbi:MAG: DUF4307 domain-containing protein [Microbacterium sp.]
MTDTADTAAAWQAELDDRYGRTRGRRTWLWIAIGIVVAAAAGWWGWGVVTEAVDAVDVDTTAYSDVSAHAITVQFQVTLRSGAAVTCAIEAQDAEHGIVGWRIVSYPADDAVTRSFTETIPTVAEPTTGLATSCWIP